MTPEQSDYLGQLEASLRWQLDTGLHDLLPPGQHEPKAWLAGYAYGLRDAIEAVDHIRRRTGAAFTGS